MNPSAYVVPSAQTVGDDQAVSLKNQAIKSNENNVSQPNYNGYIPEKKSVLNHIFVDKEGHILDSTENRRLLVETTVTENFRGVDGRGNEWYIKILDDGRQVWVEVRNGQIWDGGINSVPKPWDDYYGLKNPGRKCDG